VKTVKEWALHWLEVYAKPKVSYGTYSNYKMYVNNHIIPVLGHIKLQDVRPANIAKLYAEDKNTRGEPSSRASLRDIKTCLFGIFDTAIDNSLCGKNPAAKVPLPEKKQHEIQVYSPAQMQFIVDYLDKHKHGAYIAFLLYTGMRVGEMLSLMWSDIDTQNKTITIRRTLTKSEAGIVAGDGTKTRQVRTIPYDSVLEKHLDRLPKTGMFVFSRSNGEHHSHKTFETIYKRFINDLNSSLSDGEKIPYLSPHKCRHTFGTYLLRSGADIRVVQAVLGHTTIKTTEIYTHVNVDDLRDNIKKLKY
jgi:Site-specific recombinase XerD